MNDFVAPVLAVIVGAVLSGAIAYPLGRLQGKQQTLYQEQVKIIAEIRRLVLDANEALWLASMRPDQDDYRKDLLEKTAHLSRYHRENEIWLEQKMNEKISFINEGYNDQINKLLATEQMRDHDQVFEVEEHQASQRVGGWHYKEGRALTQELESEARKLLGTHEKSWFSKLLIR